MPSNACLILSMCHGSVASGGEGFPCLGLAGVSVRWVLDRVGWLGERSSGEKVVIEDDSVCDCVKDCVPCGSDSRRFPQIVTLKPLAAFIQCPVCVI